MSKSFTFLITASDSSWLDTTFPSSQNKNEQPTSNLHKAKPFKMHSVLIKFNMKPLSRPEILIIP